MRTLIDPEAVCRIVDRRRGRPGDVVAILEDIHAEYNFLPAEALKIVASRTERSLVDLYGMATFYRGFSLEPRGRHLASVCMGTACHVRGSPTVLEACQERLGIRPGGTTADREFSLTTVNCLGACALGPVVVTDGVYHRNVRAADVPGVIDSVHRDERAAAPRDDRRIFAVQVACPHCNRSLMSDEHPLDGYPMVRLTISFGSKHGWLRLSSLYGDYRSQAEFRVPAGAVVHCFCPHCHAELRATGLCARCDAPMVSLRVRGAGTVRFCSRNGCKEHMLDLDTAGR
jgi:NADH-quinone oxidoreductase subunit E